MTIFINILIKKYIMKKIILIFCSIFTLSSFVSCKGKQVKAIYEGYRAFTESDAYKCYKAYHRAQTVKNLLASQPSYSLCEKCNGYGILYLVDSYGNPMLDAYGNYSTVICDNCQGYGCIQN